MKHKIKIVIIDVNLIDCAISFNNIIVKNKHVIKKVDQQTTEWHIN